MTKTKEQAYDKGRELVIKDLQKVQKEWVKEKKKGVITREFYRQKGKFQSRLIDKLFGSFTEAKKECNFEEVKKITRNVFDIYKNNKESNKRYFVSAIIPNAKVNKKFWNSIQSYCKNNNAEPLLLVMRGVNSDDEFTQDILEEYQQYFVTEFQFNSNLIAKDFILSPQQILPLTGLQRYGGKNQSIIVAHSKQMMVTIPKQRDEFPHIVVSTGTICEPNYKNNRQGQIAKEDNCLGGLIVEVKDNKIFFLRVIRFDGNGFQDLNKYYSSDLVEEKNINAVIAEPQFGIEDSNAINFFKELVQLCKPKNVFLHDSFDGGSVNPHNKNKIGIRCQNSFIQSSLENELTHLGTSLEDFENFRSDIKYFHVYSNHNYFVDRYLIEGEFIKDSVNVKLGAELFLDVVNERNPIECYINREFKLKNQIFLKAGESYSFKGVELNTHGHKGSNGSKGNLKNIEISHNNAFIGHTHSPAIWRDVFQIPCLCLLQQNYNKDGSSSWLQGVGLLFENGEKQIILNINGEWKL